MPKYRVYYQTTASTHIDVEADDPQAAQDIADDSIAYPEVCAVCAGFGNHGPGIDLTDWQPLVGEHAAAVH